MRGCLAGFMLGILCSKAHLYAASDFFSGLGVTVEFDGSVRCCFTLSVGLGSSVVVLDFGFFVAKS